MPKTQNFKNWMIYIVAAWCRDIDTLSCESILKLTCLVSWIPVSLTLLSPAASRWIGCIALCCMVVLVLAFNYLGLLCGTLGYDKHASPTTRGCISNTGGTMLMAWVSAWPSATASAAAAPNCGECESIRACFPQWRRIQLHLLLGADGGGDHRLSGGRKHGEDFLWALPHQGSLQGKSGQRSRRQQKYQVHPEFKLVKLLKTWCWSSF